METRVIFTGLRGAARLNDMPGIFRRVDPTNPARCVIVLPDGAEVKRNANDYFSATQIIFLQRAYAP